MEDMGKEEKKRISWGTISHPDGKFQNFKSFDIRKSTLLKNIIFVDPRIFGALMLRKMLVQDINRLSFEALKYLIENPHNSLFD